MARRAGGVPWAVAVALTLGACTDDGIGRATPYRPPTPDESVVAIRATGCRRTSTRSVGVVVAPGLVATVAHAVAGEREVTVVLGDRSTLEATVAAIDVRMDLAVLRVPGLRVGAVASGEPKPGDAQLVSAPEGPALIEEIEIVRSVTVRTSDIYRDGTYGRPGLELSDAPVDPGDSGGGLFQDGRLVGIVWAASRLSEGRAWATEIEAYDELVEEAASGAVALPVSCGR